MDRRPWLWALIVAAGTAGLLAWYAASYSFLLDDSILIGQPSTLSAAAIVSRPVFNFYRPIEHVWLKALFAVFGWNPPWG